jgi:Mg2+ and Co2+ transporter CorA
MQKTLIEKATYNRWQNNGTMYGISKYSFVCLGEDEFALPHMQTIYFNIFSLLLMVRATILKFSSEVSDIAKNIDSKNTAGDVNNLYKRYIQFVNSFYFREITAKDQGLELYEKAMDILNIQRDIKDLDSEIEELHKYIEISNNKKETEQMNNLNKLGYIFLPGTFIAGFFGMNTFSGIDNMGGFLFSVIVIICSTLYVTKVHDIKIKDFFIKDKGQK